MTAKIAPALAGGLAVATVAATALASPASCPLPRTRHVAHHHTAYRHRAARGPYPTYAAYAEPSVGYPVYADPTPVGVAGGPAYGPAYYAPAYYGYPAWSVYYGGPDWYGGYWGPGYWRHGYWGWGGWGRFHRYRRYWR